MTISTQTCTNRVAGIYPCGSGKGDWLQEKGLDFADTAATICTLFQDLLLPISPSTTPVSLLCQLNGGWWVLFNLLSCVGPLWPSYWHSGSALLERIFTNAVRRIWGYWVKNPSANETNKTWTRTLFFPLKETCPSFLLSTRKTGEKMDYGSDLWALKYSLVPGCCPSFFGADASHWVICIQLLSTGNTTTMKKVKW